MLCFVLCCVFLVLPLGTEKGSFERSFASCEEQMIFFSQLVLLSFSFFHASSDSMIDEVNEDLRV